MFVEISRSQDCDWDDLLAAWNALYEFLKPKLQSRVPRLIGRSSCANFQRWCYASEFSVKQVSALNVSKNQVIEMMRSVCYHIINLDMEQFPQETFSLPIRPKRVDASDDKVQIIPSPNLDRNRAEPQTRLASLSKHQCFSYLARSNDRKWDNFVKAWNTMEEFIGPRLQSRASKLPSDERLQKSRNEPGYPLDQVSILSLSTGEADLMMRSVCSHVLSMEPGPEPEQAPHETVTLPKMRERDVDVSDDDVEIIPSPASIPNRARTDQQMRTLSLTTKVYFMEEDNQDSRTGIMVALLTNAKPDDGQIDIKTLRYGNATRHLAKRSNFDKNRHQIFTMIWKILE